MIQEIKRIVKESEIMKFVTKSSLSRRGANMQPERTTPNGPRKTRTGDRSSRFDSEMNTSLSRWVRRSTVSHLDADDAQYTDR